MKKSRNWYKEKKSPEYGNGSRYQIRQKKVKSLGRNGGAVCLAVCLLTIFFLTGCSKIGSEAESSRQKIDFTVVEQREIPEKLMEVIEKNKQDEIRLSYREGESLYLVRGYGQQKTGGYSIAVAECTEDETAIWFDTRLLGPTNQETLSDDPSYPYLVIKMELREKEVMIE